MPVLLHDGLLLTPEPNNLTASIVSLQSRVALTDDGCLLIKINDSYTDASLFVASDGVFEVIKQSFSFTISNNNIRNNLFKHIVDNFLMLHDIDLSNKPNASKRIEIEINRILNELSSSSQHHVYLPGIHTDRLGVKNIDIILDRNDIKQIMAQTIDELNNLIQALVVNEKPISRVILFGPLSRHQLIRGVFNNIFNTEPMIRNDESTLGSAILGGVYSGLVHQLLLLDIIPSDINIVTANKTIEGIQKWTIIPTSKTFTFSTAEENQRSASMELVEDFNGGMHTLGVINFNNLPPLAINSPIEVRIDIASDMEITAIINEHHTGYSSKVTL